MGQPAHHPGRYFVKLDNGRIRCDVCPRQCAMKPGQRGFCFVRQATDDGVDLTTYGRSSGFCIDPIEKKPLNHFYPGSSAFSFGTAGCNLGCKFCQNWDISKARDWDRMQETASPDDIADAALRARCKSVAFTYNDPIIFLEYAVDTAHACHARGIQTVAVTNGYIMPDAREEFFGVMDAANVDLKGFTEKFYDSLCFAKLGPVLETLEYIVHETSCWLEITTLLIPGHNDDPGEIERLSRWVYEKLGPDVPLHFTAFHPDYKMLDTPSTPLATLRRAREIGLAQGLRYVYTGNVRNLAGSTTFCPKCHAPVIERDGYDIVHYALDAKGGCSACGHAVAGRFAAEGAGHFGSLPVPVHIPVHA